MIIQNSRRKPSTGSGNQPCGSSRLVCMCVYVREIAAKCLEAPSAPPVTPERHLTIMVIELVWGFSFDRARHPVRAPESMQRARHTDRPQTQQAHGRCVCTGRKPNVLKYSHNLSSANYSYHQINVYIMNNILHIYQDLLRLFAIVRHHDRLEDALAHIHTLTRTHTQTVASAAK